MSKQEEYDVKLIMPEPDRNTSSSDSVSLSNSKNATEAPKRANSCKDCANKFIEETLQHLEKRSMSCIDLEGSKQERDGFYQEMNPLMNSDSNSADSGSIHRRSSEDSDSESSPKWFKRE